WRDKPVANESDPEAVVALERWLSHFSPPPPEPETEGEAKPQTTPVPLSTPPFVAPLVTYLGQRSERESSPKRRKKGWKWLLLGLGLVVVGWTVYDAFKPRLRRLESQVTQAWAANSELGVYRLDAEFEGDILQLTGKLPNRDLRDRAAKIAQDAVPGQLIDNDIIVVDRFVDEEVQQIAQTLNLLAGVDITARFEGGTAILTGTAMQPLDLDSISQSFEQVAGVQAVDNQVEIQQSAIATRIYFGQNATELKPVDIDVKIAPIAQLLRRYPQFKLKILGYGHASETNPDDLARQRSQAVQTILEDQGVDRRRLSAIASADLPPNITANQDRWLARCVVFELIETSPSTP
ncbi:MAG: BON domain-containing protein, partial [Jaaginema sp. PMC 1079.18]|nr:BON domain-containing protein [Jaaginema sp. PMC 1079.18]